MMKINCLAKHQFDDEKLTETDCKAVIKNLSQKGFIAKREDKISVNSGIAFMISSLGKAKRLFIQKHERVFTAYICGEISLLLINDTKSNNYMLYPFENEDKLVEWLNENNIFNWEDARFENEDDFVEWLNKNRIFTWKYT